jgi:nitrate/TMAO reductase-like tetraheme cytochrome c subunit
MDTSMSADAAGLLHRPLAAAAIGAAVIAAALILYYLVRRPPLGTVTKLLLLAGLGVFPIMTAGTGNLAGFETTTTRSFCRGCHVMEPWVDDASDPRSTSLAARHGRNELFGDKNCYTCHADYGMYGTLLTKVNGLHHVVAYLGGYRDVPVERAVETIRTYRPFPNSTCIHCHSMQVPSWSAVPDHRAIGAPGQPEVSCASAGCHGPAHPLDSLRSRGQSQPETAGPFATAVHQRASER